MASFLSATNDRNDGYGGCAGRPRAAAARGAGARARAAAADSYTVGCRLLAEECVAGGSGVDDAVSAYAVEFARAGMDFISLSRGGKFDDAQQPKVGEAAYPYTGPSGYECMPSYYSDARGPFGRNVPRRCRSARRCARPVSRRRWSRAAASTTSSRPRQLLAEGGADVVSIARQALADPDWFRKVRAGRGGEVRLCLYTNYCEALDQRHREVTCELWDREGLDDAAAPRSADGKRRLLPPDWTP